MDFQSKNYEIQSKFLKLVFSFFGNFSVQLYPVSWKSKWSLVNFLWNIFVYVIFVVFLTIYGQKGFDNEYETPEMQKALEKQPLFTLLVKVITPFVFPVCFNFIMLYYIRVSCKSSMLLQLLDSFKIETAERHPVLCFIVFAVQSQLLYFCAIVQPMIILSKYYSFWPELCVFYVVLYAQNVNATITFILIIYYKFATLQMLEKILKNLESKQMTQIEFKKIKFEIAKLSITNKELNYLLSFPMIFSILPYITQIITVFSSFSVLNMIETNTYLIQFVFYIGFISFLERKIQRSLTCIFRKLLKTNLSSSNLFITKFYLHSSMSSRQGHHQLEVIELEKTYRKYFKLSIYELFSINWKFCCTLVLFILNYVVLVTQTNG